jgi:hypothetical protein
MLRDKDRVAFHWCLLSVIARHGRSKPLPDKIESVGLDYIHPPGLQIFNFGSSQFEPGPELGPTKSPLEP